MGFDCIDYLFALFSVACLLELLLTICLLSFDFSFTLLLSCESFTFILGIMGEYIGRIFEETKGRPLYLIARGKPKDEADGGPSAVGARTK